MVDSAIKKIHSVAQLIVDSSYAIVLTGAGISTESGIPDFRGKSGIWKEFNPLIYGSIGSVKNDPRFFWKLAKRIAPTLLNAKPNLGHYALAELEKMGCIKCIITQNIDGLHQQAGSRKIYEVHGSILNEFICMSCGTAFPSKEIIPQVIKGIPKCEGCGGFLKPDVVFFGEELPEDQITRSLEVCNKADLILVAGSALEVYPVNQIPQLVVSNGGKLVIINDEPTWLDDITKFVFHEKTGKILPKIIEEVKKLL
jgi:NAD-dependent deacetylase